MHLNPSMLGMQGINPMGGLNPNQMGGIPIAVPGPNGGMMLMMPSGMNPQQQGSSSSVQGQSGMPNMQLPGLGGMPGSIPFASLTNPFGINLSQFGQPNNQNSQNSN